MIAIVSCMYGRRSIKMTDKEHHKEDYYPEYPSYSKRNYSDLRQHLEPWYDFKTDYNTNAESYYQYLARYNRFLEYMEKLMNNVLDGVEDMWDVIGSDDYGHYYINVQFLKANGDGETDNTQIFNKFIANQIYYVPEGTYKMAYFPEGLYFGYGEFLINGKHVPLDKKTPQPVNRDINSDNNEESYYSWISGQDAGENEKPQSYANTGAGYAVLRNNEEGRRLTAFGKGAMDIIKGGYSNQAFGSDALGQGSYGQRNTALGDNALKWGGVTDALATLHDFWLETGNKNFINNYFVPRYPKVWDILGSESKPKQDLYPKKDGEYEHNIGVGRNALLHAMKAVNNVALGYNSQAHTLLGNGNASMGDRSLRDNLTGNRNTAIGNYSQTNNITGQDNASLGSNTLQQTLHAFNNTSIGYGSMHFFKDDKNSDPEDGYATRNTAIGTQSMQDGKNSSYSVMVGSYAGRYVEGDHNVGVGSESSVNITTGEQNVGVGSNTLREIEEGSNNTAIGYTSGPTGDYSYTTSLGSNAHPQGNHQVQVGGADDTVYAHKSLQVRSDKRLKKEVKDTIMGLDYITKLRPVDFKYNNSNSDRFHHGLIAQEVEEIPDYAFGGVDNPKYTGGDDVYNLSYEEFIAPLIKSVQELTQRVELLEKENQELKKG